MKITNVRATWVHVPIPPERQHVSDFGKIASFDSVIVKIDTDAGHVGWGEAKAGVGSASAAADVLQPDLAIAGGLTEGVRIASIASAYNLRLAPHLWSGAPAFAAGLALAASQSAGFILEYSLGANPLLHELVHEKFPVTDGQVEIPDRPGLGITVDEDFVRRHARE